MSTQDDGGSAFPADATTNLFSRGMSLRDYFAAGAMQAALVNARLHGLTDGNKEAARMLDEACGGFYMIADAMLKAREN